MVAKRRQRTRKPRAQQSNKHNKAAKAKLCKEICMRVNPFDAGACCACIDSSTTRAVPFTLRQRIPVTTLATGDFCLYIKSTITDNHRSAATIVSGAVTGWGAYQALSGYSNNIDKVRINQIGVRYFGSSAPSDSAGIVGMSQGTYNATFDTTSELYDDLMVTRQYESDLSIALKPQGDASQEYFDYTYAAADPENGWPGLHVFGSGLAASTSIGYVEIIFHCEGKPDSGDFLNNYSATAGPNIPQVEALISNVRGKIPTTQEGTAKYTNLVERIVGKDVAAFLETIAPVALQAMVALL